MDNADMPTQKDLLQDIIKNADSLTLEQIKQGWEINRAIAERIRALKDEIKGYKDEILQSQVMLKDLRQKHAKLSDEYIKLESKKQQINEEVEELKSKLDVQRLINKAKQPNIELEQARKQILPGALKSVEIYLKDGSIAKAKPAQKIFGEDIYKKYRVELKENNVLKNKISELEIENKRLSIEIRDFYTDLALESMGALESKESIDEIHLPNTNEIIASEEDLREFKKMLEENKRKKDKKS